MLGASLGVHRTLLLEMPEESAGPERERRERVGESKESCVPLGTSIHSLAKLSNLRQM